MKIKSILYASLALNLALISTLSFTLSSGSKLSANILASDVPFRVSVFPKGGEYSTSRNVAISSNKEGIKIYFTMDGSTPTRSSMTWDTSTTKRVAEDSVLRYLAVLSDGQTSQGREVYKVNRRKPVYLTVLEAQKRDAKNLINKNSGIVGDHVSTSRLSSAVATAEELAWGLANTDTDNDGLSDAEELFYQTDPRMADTDGDGMKDSDEVLNERDPTKKGAGDFQKYALKLILERVKPSR